MSSRSEIHWFRMLTRATLFILVGIILLLLATNVAYTDRKSFLETITSPEFRSAFSLSLSTSFFTTFLALVVAIPAAYALSRYPFRGVVLLDVFVDFLIVMPVLVIGVSLLVFLRLGADLAESPHKWLQWIGIAMGWLSGFFVYQKAGVVLAQFFCAVSFAVRALKSSFSGISIRTEQVAMTLGCTPFQAFWRITLPMARHGILAAAVLAWSRAFEVFGAVTVVAGAVRRRTEVLPTSIYLEFSIGRIETALAISLVMLAVAFVILLAMRSISRGDIFGGGGRT